MDRKFIYQPFGDQASLLEILPDLLNGMSNLLVVVAWAKRSGLSRLQHVIDAFRRHGTATMIVGIDEGAATRQGLELALVLFDAVYVVHDKAGRTFHPKLYIAENDTEARVLIGSNNMTAGGLFYNYEAALLLELQKANPADAHLLSQVKTFVNRLLDDRAVCIKLTLGDLATLVRERRYQISDEDRPRRQPPTDVGDSDTGLDVGGDRIFGRSQERKKWLPLGPTAPMQPVAPAIETLGYAAPAKRVARRWTKRLTYSDAQQPQRTGSHPTGNMRLTQAGHPIDQRTYFREVFFGDVTWMSRPGMTLEAALLPFEVWIGGKTYGVVNLKVDHDPRRVAGQNNAPTFLHWGDELGVELRQSNYAGCFVALERSEDGSYRLVISTAYPGPFIGDDLRST